MRILLVNEASGVHRNLKRGLEALGHEAVHALSAGRALQGRPADAFLGVEGSGIAAAVRRHVRGPLALARLGRFDVANFVLGLTAMSGRLLRYRDLAPLRASGVLLSHYAVGCDEPGLVRLAAPGRRELPCGSCLAQDAMGAHCDAEILGRRPAAAPYARLFARSAVSMPDYAHAPDFFPEARASRIPLPVDAADIAWAPANPRGARARIAHTPTRSGFKGTERVRAAIALLAARRDDFEYLELRDLPYAAYLDAVRASDVLVDQTFSESPGMAALESLAMGKVVVSGYGAAAREWFGASPIVDADPDPATLADRIAGALDARERWASWSEEGRAFVARVHDPVVVAERFVAHWGVHRSRPLESAS